MNENLYGYRVDDREPIYESDVEEMVREVLDELNPEVEVAGMTFSPSRVIEELDPTAFRMTVLDYWDSLVKDGDYVESEDDLPAEDVSES